MISESDGSDFKVFEGRLGWIPKILDPEPGVGDLIPSRFGFAFFNSHLGFIQVEAIHPPSLLVRRSLSRFREIDLSHLDLARTAEIADQLEV